MHRLEYIWKTLYEKIRIDIKWLFKNDYNIIKQALLKAQEQVKALSIIKEKNVDIDFLKSAETFDEYNRLIKFNICFATELTEEEFELLKRYLVNE